MKNLLLLAVLAVATTGAAIAAPSQTTPTGTMTKQERKAARQAARQAKTPQVYKGTVAEQSRVLTDAPGSEDSDNGDNTTTKSKKKSKSKE
jgi:opacity protein-like surface antigen